jgi:hypothetical protein
VPARDREKAVGFASPSICATVSDSSGFERWLMCPVCRRNSGATTGRLMPRRSTPSCLWSYPSSFCVFPTRAFAEVVFTVLFAIWTHKAPVWLFVALARQLDWRAARVRESREPAPLMGRVSFVQTARGGPLFPMGLLTN